MRQSGRIARTIGRSLFGCVFALGAIAATPVESRGDAAMSIEPAVRVVPRGAYFDLSLVIDGVDTMSNFQAFIRFDPAILEFAGATEGSLYVYTGEWDNTWFFFEEESLGTWEIFDVIFPAGSYILPPGELASLRLLAREIGVTHVEYLAASARDILRNPILPLRTEDGLVMVENPTGLGVADSGANRWGLGSPSPNPTSGAVTIRILGPAGRASASPRCSVFDIRGRLIRELCIPLAGGALDIDWDGKDRGGSDAPPGVYFLRLETSDRAWTRRVTVVR